MAANSNSTARPWDYLIVTASNDLQAAAYRMQLSLRERLGLLGQVGAALVVPDPQGRRVGSGGSTIYCLMEVLSRELSRRDARAFDEPLWAEILSNLRILIIHAGGDSKRLPAYGPCGKIFVPVPSDEDMAVPTTLFDRQLPTFLALPPSADGGGQVVVAGGDALIRFDPKRIRFEAEGLTALGCRATPEHAARHGVFCADANGQVRLFLQKPSPDVQRKMAAVDSRGRSILDVAVMSFDVSTSMALLRMFGARADGSGKVAWPAAAAESLLAHGLDMYREICCAMGTQVTPEHHVGASRGAGSTWDDAALARMCRSLAGVKFFVQVLDECDFLHFGTTRQLISSGQELMDIDRGGAPEGMTLMVNNAVTEGGRVAGKDSWVEGCRVRSTLELAGQNVVVGVDVDRPLALPPGACLDVLKGTDRDGTAVWFVRCYGVTDQIKDSPALGATFCNMPVRRWLELVGADLADVWPAAGGENSLTLWDARLFPAEPAPDGYRNWLWMFEPDGASDRQRRAWRQADRFSIAEMAALTDLGAFFDRRAEIVARLSES